MEELQATAAAAAASTARDSGGDSASKDSMLQQPPQPPQPSSAAADAAPAPALTLVDLLSWVRMWVRQEDAAGAPVRRGFGVGVGQAGAFINWVRVYYGTPYIYTCRCGRRLPLPPRHDDSS